MVSTSKKLAVIGILFFAAMVGWGQAVIPVHTNYSTSDQSIYGSNYGYASYRLHAQSDSLALGMAFVVCDTFPDLISGNNYPIDFLQASRLDSVRIRMNLSKHSSQNDTLYISLAGTYNGVFPNENMYHHDTIIFSTSFSPGNTYASSSYFTLPIDVYVTSSFTLFIGFKGQANDTLRLWSGYGYDGICATQPNLKRAQQSHYFPNSFAYRKEFGQLLPTLSGEDIFIECDTVNGFDTLTDGRNYIQNWDVDFYFTSTTASLSENVLAKTPLLYPNPSSGMVYLRDSYEEITVLSSSGKTVWQGTAQANSVYLPLPAGFYLVRVKNGAETSIEKLIITDK